MKNVVRVSIWAMITVLMATGVGCAHDVAQKSLANGRGVVSFSPTLPSGVLMDDAEQHDSVLIPPTLRNTRVLPQYPNNLTGRDRRPVIIAVNLLVGTDGRVRQVELDALRPSTPTEQPELFLKAIRVGVADWRFWPAAIRKKRAAEENDAPPDVLVEAPFPAVFSFTPPDV